MEIVNDSSTAILSVTFKDEGGVLVIPTSANYRIDDVEGGTTILASTAFPSLASTVDLTLTSAQMAILNDDLTYETRRVTVEFIYSGGKKGTAEFLIAVRNLKKVPV